MSELPVSLPVSVRNWLTNVGEVSNHEVVRQRHQAITVVNKSLNRVYKFVLATAELQSRLELEVSTLTNLAQAGVPGPRVVGRDRVDEYEVVEFEYVPGDIRAGSLSIKDVQLIAATQRQLHSSFLGKAAPSASGVLVNRVLYPILDSANSIWFAPEIVEYARQLQSKLLVPADSSELTLVHTDGHFWNVVFTEDSAVLIDWAEAGFGPRYFDLGVTVEALLLEAEELRCALINAYLHAYFGGNISASDLAMVQSYFELRCLEGMTWHLNESTDTQRANREESMGFIAECWRTLHTQIGGFVSSGAV